MPYGYLVTVATAVLATAISLRPPRRPALLARLGFRASVLVNEMPAVVLVWLAASTAMAGAEGDLDSPGAVAIALTGVASVPALFVLARRGLRAEPALDAAMTRALGPTWRVASEGPGGPRRRGASARAFLVPFIRRRRDVERIRNIAYGDAGRRNLLDVYRHRAKPAGAAPVLIHMHGGSYTGGHKNSQSLPLIYRFAAQGWVCVSANYRLRPGAVHPDHLIDLKKVIAWVKANIHVYGGDPRAVIVSGSSAGGHMASLAALTPGEPAYQPGFEDADTSVLAAISLNGYHGNYYGQGDESSPLAHVRPDAPPFFIAHGDIDTVVHVDNAREFAGALGSVSRNTVVYAELPGAQHAFDLFRSVRFESVVDAVEAFAAHVLRTVEDGGAPDVPAADGLPAS